VSSDRYEVAPLKTDISKAKISYIVGLSLFNPLPSDLKTTKYYTVSSFTIKFKEFFLQLTTKYKVQPQLIEYVDEFSCAIYANMHACRRALSMLSVVSGHKKHVQSYIYMVIHNIFIIP
jgi:hypothetical protein